MANNPEVATGRRALYPLIDAGVFIGLWQAVMGMTGVRFPFAIMQTFSRADYDAYVRVMSWMTLGLFVLSIAMHATVSGSIGKYLTGMKTVQTNGAPMTLRQSTLRAVAMFLLGILILAPGPLVAFLFGKGSEPGSFAALSLGFLALWFATFSFGRTQSRLERALGIKTVPR